VIKMENEAKLDDYIKDNIEDAVVVGPSYSEYTIHIGKFYACIWQDNYLK